MKNLTLTQMENVEGGLSWYAGCAAGASTMYLSGAAALAGAVTGGWGFFGALAVGCAVGALS